MPATGLWAHFPAQAIGQMSVGAVADSTSFPYEPFPTEHLPEDLWRFFLPDRVAPFGFMLRSTVAKMPWDDHFDLDIHSRSVILLPTSQDDLGNACSLAISAVLTRARDSGHFPSLGDCEGEKHLVMGTDYPVVVERAGATLFGLVSRGVHMTVYTLTCGSLKIWTPRRSSHMRTYPGMLDNSVAGGIGMDETPFQCLIREAEEEAGLSNELVRSEAISCGTLSYFQAWRSSPGSEYQSLQPGLQYVYDLQVDEDVVLRPSDGEVAEFNLWSTEQVMQALRLGEYKPSCALVLIDFFIRHGVIRAENERDFAEIAARLHRRLPLPMREPRPIHR